MTLKWTKKKPTKAEKAAYYASYYSANKERIRLRKLAKRAMERRIWINCSDCGMPIKFLGGTHKRCADCVKAWDRKYAAQRRIPSQKFKQECVVCGITFSAIKNQLACAACVPKYRKVRSTKRAKERLRTDPQFYWAGTLRRYVNGALRSPENYDKYKFFSLVGCSVRKFKQHLQSLFKPGMNWENRGQWEIDHIRPCCAFDLTDGEQRRLCFHFTNTQPLWRSENRDKAQTTDRLFWAGPIPTPTDPKKKGTK